MSVTDKSFKDTVSEDPIVCLVIGDSLPLPSSELKYEDTWIFKLSKKCEHLHVVNRCIRSSSATRLNGEGPEGKDILEFYSPSIVITHLGIPDAAPRLLKRNKLTTHIINHLPFSKLIYDFVRKTKGRTIENCDLSPDVFFGCFDNYAKRCNKYGVKLLIIEISEGTTVLNVSPRFNESVKLYNSKLHLVAEYNDNVTIIPAITSEMPECYQSDGLHLNKIGQRKIYSNVLNYLKQYKFI